MNTFDDSIHRSKPAAADGGLLVTLPPRTELTYPKGYGYGVSFPIRPSQDIVLRFMTKAEWDALSAP